MSRYAVVIRELRQVGVNSAARSPLDLTAKTATTPAICARKKNGIIICPPSISNRGRRADVWRQSASLPRKVIAEWRSGARKKTKPRSISANVKIQLTDFGSLGIFFLRQNWFVARPKPKCQNPTY